MISADKLRGDLAIELDAEFVSAGEFRSAFESFLVLVRELTRQINDSLPQDAWLLTVQDGSQVITLVPDKSRLPEAIASQVYGALFDGLDVLETEAKTPQYFTERALECARELSLVAFGPRDAGIPIRILSRERARVVTRATYIHVSELLDWNYEDLGTVDGTLEVVSAHNGYEFRLYEPVWLRAVRCTISEDLLPDALSNFRKRVEVQGLVRYTKDGFPVSVRVVKISAFPEPKDLASFRAVRGILSGRDGA